MPLLSEKRYKELEKKVKEMAPKVWNDIAADAGDCTLEEMAELVIDADRPVFFGHMTKADYDEVCTLPLEDIDTWLQDALKRYA